MAGYTRYTKEKLQEAVAQAHNWSDVCRFFGKPQAGGSRSHLQRKILELGISVHHFTRLGRGWSRGMSGRRQKTPGEILRIDSERKRPPGARLLRRALLQSGVPHVCAQCGCPPVWQGAPLVLQVDHRNGNRHDSSKNNLRFLCPNCHSQTENWGR